MHKLRYCLEVDCLESHENANDVTVNWLSLAHSQIVLVHRKANSFFAQKQEKNKSPGMLNIQYELCAIQ